MTLINLGTLAISGCLLISLIFRACTGHHEGAIVIETFEGDSYGEWQSKGNAFKQGPGDGFY